jgi:hypothetical protein
MTSTKAPDGQMKQWNPADVMVLDKDSGPFEYGPQNQSYYLASEADALIAKLREENKELRELADTHDADFESLDKRWQDELTAERALVARLQERISVQEATLAIADKHWASLNEQANDLAATVIAERARAEAAELDARRYRWMRGNGAIVSRGIGVPVQHSCFGVGLDDVCDKMLSAESAMSATEGKGEV